MSILFTIKVLDSTVMDDLFTYKAYIVPNVGDCLEFPEEGNLLKVETRVLNKDDPCIAELWVVQ